MCIAINSSGRPRCPPSLPLLHPPAKPHELRHLGEVCHFSERNTTQHDVSTHTQRMKSTLQVKVDPKGSSLIPFHISECDFSSVRVFWYFWCCKTFAGYVYLLEWSRFENRVAQLCSSITNSTSNFMDHFFKKDINGTVHTDCKWLCKWEKKYIVKNISSFPVWPGELVTPAGMSLHQDAKNICTFQAQWKRHSNQNSAGVILLTSYGRRIKTDIMTALKSPRTRRLVTGTR